MTAATTESKWGLGVIAITKGEYDKAVNFFGTEPCFNLALAQLLKGDVNKAKATLDGIKEPCKCGKPSYLKAVVGARLDDRTYMLNGLREAIGFKPEWKAYAKTDLEFAKFFNDDTFKSFFISPHRNPFLLIRLPQWSVEKYFVALVLPDSIGTLCPSCLIVKYLNTKGHKVQHKVTQRERPYLDDFLDIPLKTLLYDSSSPSLPGEGGGG